MLHWLLLDGLDTSTLPLAQKSLTQHFGGVPPILVEDKNHSLAFSPPWIVATNALQCLISGVEQKHAHQVLSDTIENFVRDPAPLQKVSRIQVIGFLAEAEHKIGFTHLMEFLRRVLPVYRGQVELHLILPPPREKSILLPVDCLYQLDKWIATNHFEDRLTLASFAGSDQAFYEPRNYLRKIFKPVGVPRFSEIKPSLQKLIRQGFSESNIPLTIAQDYQPPTHDSLFFPICTFKPFLEEIVHFTGPSQIGIPMIGSDFPPVLFETLEKAGDVTVYDISEQQNLSRFLSPHLSRLKNVKISKSELSSESNSAFFSVTYDDRIQRAVNSGIQNRVVKALQEVGKTVQSYLSNRRNETWMLSGVSTTTYSLTDWNVHTKTPHIPVWTLGPKSKIRTDQSTCSPQDIPATVLDLLGMDLPKTMTGKSLFSHI